MKKNFYYLSLLLGLVLGMTMFTACGGDDDDDNGGGASGTYSESSVIGVWEGPVHIKGQNVHPGGKIDYIDEDIPANEFERVEVKADHTYIGYTQKKGSYVTDETGTWKLEGNKFIVTDDHETKVLTIVRLNNNTFVYTSDVIDYNIEGAYMEFTLRKVQ